MAERNSNRESDAPDYAQRQWRVTQTSLSGCDEPLEGDQRRVTHWGGDLMAALSQAWGLALEDIGTEIRGVGPDGTESWLTLTHDDDAALHGCDGPALAVAAFRQRRGTAEPEETGNDGCMIAHDWFSTLIDIARKHLHGAGDFDVPLPPGYSISRTLVNAEH